MTVKIQVNQQFKYNDMFIWGRNNNHLFKQNHKKTYSLPQKIPFQYQIVKCAPGYDYIMILTQAPGQLICYYQSAFYQVSQFRGVVDVATTDNMVVVVDKEGQAWIMEFNADKIMGGEVNPSKIGLKEHVCKVYMNYSDIFLQSREGEIYHMKRNEWYQTKSYSDPALIQGLTDKSIIKIAPGLTYNYFLTSQGAVYMSDKLKPTHIFNADLKINFKDISASEYFVGIGMNGRLFIWGKYNQQTFDSPVQFGQLTQHFINVQVSGDNGYAVTDEGQGWIWGKNANGELGLSDYQPRVKPYPLITLERQRIRDIFIGQCYTICTVQPVRHKKEKGNNNLALRISFNKQNSRQMFDHKKELHPPLLNKKCKKIGIEESSSVKMRKKEKSPLKMRINTKVIQTEVVRQNHRKNKTTERTPQKIFEKTNRSISPIISQNSRSKSPQHKSPYLEHLRNHSHSNLKKKKEHSLNRSNIDNKSKTNSYVQFYKNKVKEFEDETNIVRQIANQKEEYLGMKLRETEEENIRLRKNVEIKEKIIDDITQKIQLLEEAIEEHERNLTARDNKVEEYQRREKEYEIHIDQLQKHIQTLIKGKDDNANQPENLYNDMYNNLKLDFAKEKEHFMNKMSEYEQILMNERTQYKEEIRHLQEEINTHRSANQQQKQNKVHQFSLGLKNSKQGNREPIQLKPLDESSQRMNFIISRIEDSKVRIAKSATKLYQMMDDK